MNLRDYIHNHSSVNIEVYDLVHGVIDGDTQFKWKVTIHFNGEAARFEDNGDFVLDFVNDPDQFQMHDYDEVEDKLIKQLRVAVVNHIIDSYC
jgi:hypothetical protein